MFSSSSNLHLRARRVFGSAVTGVLFAACALVAYGGIARGQAPAKIGDSIERLIPADVIAAVSTDDAAAAARQFSATPLGVMLRSRAWASYFSAVDESQTACALHLRPWFGIDWQDLAGLSAPVCLCLVADAKGQPAWAIVVDVKGRPDAAKELSAKAAAYFQKYKARVTQEPDKQRTIYALPATAKDAVETVVYERDGIMAFITARGGADRLASFWQSDRKASLASASAWRDVQTQSAALLKSPPDVRWWLRPLPLVRALPAPPAGRERGRRDWRAEAEKLGLVGVEAAGGVIHLARSNSASIESSLVVLAPRPFQKGLQLASLKPGAWRDPPAWAGANAAAWSLAHYDAKLSYEGLGTVFDVKAGPGNEGAFRDFVDRLQLEPGGPQINIRREILPRLKSGTTQVSDFGGPKEAWNPTGRRDLMVLDAIETAELEKVFRRWFAVDVEDKTVRVEVVRGQTLWATRPGGNLFIDLGENEERTITSLAITGDGLLLSTDEAWLRSILEAKEPNVPLVKGAPFTSAASYLKSHESPETALRAFARGDANWRLPYEQIKGAKDAKDEDATQMLLQLLLVGKRDGVPAKIAAALPDWKDIAPSLGMSAVSLRVSPGGFSGTVGTLPDARANAGEGQP